MDKSRAGLSCHGAHGLVRVTDINPSKVAAVLSAREEQYGVPEAIKGSSKAVTQGPTSAG